MVGKVEKLDFSSQSFINKFKTNNTEKQRMFGFTNRQIFYSHSPVESWHINECGLFSVQQRILGSNATMLILHKNKN